MTEVIKFDGDKKLRVCIESTDGYPGFGVVERRLPGVEIRWEPAEMMGSMCGQGDRVIAYVTGGPVSRQLTKVFDLKTTRLPASGYCIGYKKTRKGNCLVVVGGDLFGMLAGLSEAMLWCDISKRGLSYRGGDRIEKPAFPLRYYWTWDHSTNWVLDDPGNQVSGCVNQYLKKPETYVEDYRRLVDHCVDMRFNGILIWGFLRDAHGGEDYAYQVAKYAADRGVAILPGVGTTGYGGVYYEGNHPCNLETYLSEHPEKGNTWKRGDAPSARELSPYYPENREWMQECLEWLYEKFPIGGCNMENNDLMVDDSALARKERKKIKSGEADYFKDQFFAYKSALDKTHKLAPDAWNTYATYSGFGMGRDVSNAGADMWKAPYYSNRMPASAIAQWTITGMVRQDPVPLRDWLTSARPKGIYDNPRWPKGLLPPTPRSVGFLHQASQWSHIRRTALALSTFAEGCLRSFESGLEGISVHGEVTSRALPWHLNYLAMRHWTYHPVSSLEQFAESELVPRLGGKREALDYVRALALNEEGQDEESWRKIVAKHHGKQFPRNYPDRGDYSKFRMWEAMCEWTNSSHRGTQYGFGDIA